MVMEESVITGHGGHSPSGGDGGNNNGSTGGGATNVYLVGLEFVRQYYTVLNQGPLYLHRFYSDDSSFVHGVSARESKTAYGQAEIHKRIQSLNFHNCHAKIRQVDSHETLGNGVVIQVTGELSNNGQPMRRFMQTFVLAPQTPKRYYVRNDIFHYQDEVFCDDELEQENAVETGVEHEDIEDTSDGHLSSTDVNGSLEPPPPSSSGPIPSSATIVEVSAEPTRLVSASSPNKGGGIGMEEEETNNKIVEEVSASVSSSSVVPTAVVEDDLSTSSNAPVVSAVPPSATPPQVSAAVPPVAVVNNSAPKTYANLFKNSGSGIGIPPSKPPTMPPPVKFQPPSQQGKGGSPNNSQFSVNTSDGSGTSPPQVSPQPGGVKGLPPKNPRGQGSYGNRGEGRPQMDGKDRRERLTSRSSTTLNDDTGSMDGDRRRPVHTYPDANQLFVGNLPHFVTIQDMKDIFQEFGEVAEVKIQKPTPKSGGMKVPYFCFVVFEEAASASAAIERKSEIFMKMNGGTQRRLNVEPKRSQRGGGPRGDDNDGGYNRMDTASPAGNRGSEGGRGGGGGNSRTFRGSNRGGGDHRGGGRGGGGGGGSVGGGGGGGMNSGGRGGRGGNNSNKP